MGSHTEKRYRTALSQAGLLEGSGKKAHAAERGAAAAGERGAVRGVHTRASPQETQRQLERIDLMKSTNVRSGTGKCFRPG